MVKKGDNYIAWLSDLSKDDILLVGGKGANLGEMYNSKFPVPQAFVVTTDAFKYFLKQSKLEDEIKGLLHRIDVDDTADLTSKAEEIRNLGTQLFKRLCNMTGNINRLGKDIEKCTATYNRTVGALETRVMTSARKFESFEIGNRELDKLKPIDPVNAATKQFNQREKNE